LLLSLGKRNQYNKRKLPIPVKVIKSHHPDLFTSCNLLTLTEILGKQVKNKTNKDIEPISLPLKRIISKRKASKANINSNNLQYQYSDLFALPEKIIYLFRQIFIA